MGLQRFISISRRVSLACGSLSATIASVQPFASITSLQGALVGGIYASGAIAVGAAICWGVGLVLERHGSAVSHASQARESDLAEIRKKAVGYFGEKVSPLERMKQWAARNPDLFSVITTERRRGTRRIFDLEGYVCVVPLSKKAADDLLAERRGINDLSAEEVCLPKTMPSAVYVGAVATDSEAARGVALQAALAVVRRMARNRRDVKIMTRPVTNDGLRLVRAFGLQPVCASAADPLGILHVGLLGDLVPERRRARRSKKVPPHR